MLIQKNCFKNKQQHLDSCPGTFFTEASMGKPSFVKQLHDYETTQTVHWSYSMGVNVGVTDDSRFPVLISYLMRLHLLS